MSYDEDDQSRRYDYIKDIGSGNFGATRLMRDRQTKELVAIKFLERGDKIDRNVEREIVNHRMLQHPNIIGFNSAFLTPTHLAIVMEYASGGELFDRIVKIGRFSEDEARYFFQQLISGVDFCHQSGVCHRDLKLENILLDGSPAPLLKICDFGYSKSTFFDSQPKSTVGTPAYIAPEVLSKQQYDGRKADVWSCGVTLYVMLVGAYPFEDRQDPRNFRKTIERIMQVKYAIPEKIKVSNDCRNLLHFIFQADPNVRISISQIKSHPWYLKNLPDELRDGYKNMKTYAASAQSVEDIKRTIRDARVSRTQSPSTTQQSYDATGSEILMPMEDEQFNCDTDLQ